MGCADNIGVVFDFDGTLIEKKIRSLVDFFDRKILSPRALAEMEDMRRTYLERALDGQLTHAEETDWLDGTLDIYVRERVTELDIAWALSGVPLRDGVARCLQVLHGRGVRVGIVSYGVEQFIRACLAANCLSDAVDGVFAARIIFGDNGSAVGYDRGRHVLPSSKGVWSARFARSHGIAEHRLFAVGDSGADALLGSVRRNRLGIAETREQAEQIRPHMGDVVVTTTFDPVTEWLLRRIDGG